MNRRNAIYVRHLDLDPQTAPDTDLDDDLDDYDYYNDLDDDD